MAISNHERVGKALDLLKAGLAPFVEREFAGRYRDQAAAEARRLLPADDRVNGGRPVSQWDASAVLRLMWDAWNDLFGKTLGRSERSLVQELRDVRNRWAHQEAFSSDDADRALDSMTRLLTAVSAPSRYHGTVALDPTRVGRDAGRVADEVIAHLAGLVGANVKITLEIEAEVPGGVPDQVVRIVTENGRTLKFASQGFEKD